MKPARSKGWLEVAEVGGIWGLKLVVFVVTVLGRWPARGLLRVVALYHAVFNRTARRASKRYHQQLGEPAGFLQIYNHLLRFSQVALDRLFFLSGRLKPFEVRLFGHELIVEAHQSGRGALLLGAHLGSFESMRAAAVDYDIRINVVGDFSNAERINAILEQFGDNSARMVDAGGDVIQLGMKIGSLIQRGEIVAILGDRAGHGGDTEVEFLGAPARFPTGIYALAHTLKCPVLLTFGLHYSPNRYDLYCEEFANRVELPRRGRRESITAYAQQYARRLEHFCRLAPDNWFNFYDFWSDDESP